MCVAGVGSSPSSHRLSPIASGKKVQSKEFTRTARHPVSELQRLDTGYF
jgi:hypothetical protein